MTSVIFYLLHPYYVITKYLVIDLSIPEFLYLYLLLTYKETLKNKLNTEMCRFDAITIERIDRRRQTSAVNATICIFIPSLTYRCWISFTTAVLWQSRSHLIHGYFIELKRGYFIFLIYIRQYPLSKNLNN